MNCCHNVHVHFPFKWNWIRNVLLNTWVDYGNFGHCFIWLRSWYLYYLVWIVLYLCVWLFFDHFTIVLTFLCILVLRIVVSLVYLSQCCPPDFEHCSLLAVFNLMFSVKAWISDMCMFICIYMHTYKSARFGHHSKCSLSLYTCLHLNSWFLFQCIL